MERLRIGLMDPVDWNYDMETPIKEPLGGSQSAFCYLAAALARKGHLVRVFNNINPPRTIQGVEWVNIGGIASAKIADLEYFIVLNCGKYSFYEQLRKVIPDNAKIIMWCQHDVDQPDIQELKELRTIHLIDGYAFVSDWQAIRYAARFALPVSRIFVARNAISPMFLNLYSKEEKILSAKPMPPVLIYSSTPFRGLNILLESFPLIRREIPGTVLRVFSSMRVYHMTGDADRFHYLYDLCRKTEGVEYHGSVPQAQLAKEMKSAYCLAYPNVFPETSCITVMEAMAAGCMVVTSDLGALPETGVGYPRMAAWPARGEDNVREFSERLLHELRSDLANPDETEVVRRSQVDLMNYKNTWDKRSDEWTLWLHSLRNLLPPIFPRRMVYFM